MIRIAERPKISKKNLGSKVEPGTKWHRIMTVGFIKEACCRSKLGVRSQSRASQAGPLHRSVTQSAKHGTTHQAFYVSSSPEVNKAIHKCKVKLELKCCGTVIYVCKWSVELKLVCVNNLKLGHFSPFLSMQKAVFSDKNNSSIHQRNKK